MDKNELKELIDLMHETDVTEIDIESEGKRIRIKRGPQPAVGKTEPIEIAKSSVLSEGDETAEATGSAKPANEDSYVKVNSPIVGSFYSSPSPDALPFVEVGTDVTKGQVLCIIEAMKLMNEIESDANGTIVSVLAQNGQSVEYGQPLFLIDPK